MRLFRFQIVTQGYAEHQKMPSQMSGKSKKKESTACCISDGTASDCHGENDSKPTKTYTYFQILFYYLV